MTGFVRAVSIVAAAAVVVSSVAVMVTAVVVGMTGAGLPWWQVGACVVVGVDGFAAMLAGVGWLARLFPVARPAPPVEVWAVSDEEWESLGPAGPTVDWTSDPVVRSQVWRNQTTSTVRSSHATRTSW